MTISAMKQALDALERGRPQIIGVLVQQDQDAAITALRQAIEQAEKQEPVAWEGWVLREVYFSEGEPISHREPQPVAWMDAITKEIYWRNQKNHDVPNLPLYTAPVHASDISQECVDETAKRGHELVGACVTCGAPHGFWLCEPPTDFISPSVVKAISKSEWVEQPDLARVGEVGVWGDKREWVGLTDEERGMVVNANFGIGVWEMARAIEAKLREKNT